MGIASERPDLAYVMKESAKYLQHSMEKDYERLTCVLKYVKKLKEVQRQLVMKTKEMETAQKKEDSVIHVCVDATWASDEQRCYLWLQDEMCAKQMEIKGCVTVDSSADMMTKELGKRHWNCRMHALNFYYVIH